MCFLRLQMILSSCYNSVFCWVNYRTPTGTHRTSRKPCSRGWRGKKRSRSIGRICHGVSHQVGAPAKTFLGWHLPHWDDDRRSRGVVLSTCFPFSSQNGPLSSKDLVVVAATMFVAGISSVPPHRVLFSFIWLFTRFRGIFLLF